MVLKRFTIRQRKEAADMLKNGASVEQVALHFAVSRPTIYEVKKEFGIGHTKANRASHDLRIRITPEEMEQLNLLEVEGRFTNRSAAVRHVLRAALGLLSVTRNDRFALDQLLSEFKSQGVNINQLSRQINRAAKIGQGAFTDEDRELLRQTKQSYVELHKFLRATVSEARQSGRNALHTADG